MNNNNNVVQNASKGYGYNYASLADIAMQGHKIPKMKTVTETDGRDFVYYYDPEFKEWLRGAEIVIPDGGKMNKAQLSGAAISYARKYTTLIANCLATTDDALIEEIDENGEKKSSKAKKKVEKVDTKKVESLREQMFKKDDALTQAEIDWLVKSNNLTSPLEITDEMVAVLRRLQEERRNANRKTG